MRDEDADTPVAQEEPSQGPGLPSELVLTACGFRSLRCRSRRGGSGVVVGVAAVPVGGPRVHVVEHHAKDASADGREHLHRTLSGISTRPTAARDAKNTLNM